MNLVFSLGLALILAGCGIQEEKEKPSYQRHVDRFFELAKQYNAQLSKAPIEYKIQENIDPEEDAVAACAISRDGKKEIIFFEKSFWEAASETRREMVVFHELGHCKLRRKHYSPTEAIIRNGALTPKSLPSLMDTYLSLIEDSFYEKYKALFIQELFDLRGKPRIYLPSQTSYRNADIFGEEPEPVSK